VNRSAAKIGRRGDQLIPRLGEPEAKPEIGRLGDQLTPEAKPEIGRPGDQLIPEAKPEIVLRQIGRPGDQLIPKRSEDGSLNAIN